MKNIYLLWLTIFCVGSLNAQFTESFENEAPGDWTIIDNDGQGKAWGFGEPNGGARTGTNVAYITYESNAHDDYLITPSMAVSVGTLDRIRFFARSRSPFYLEAFDVKLSTTGTNVENFTEVLATGISAPAGSWTEYIYDLASYEGQTVYVAIVATSTNQYELYIDDFEAGIAPSCPASFENVTATNITNQSANINWSSTDSIETSWEIAVQPEGMDAPTMGTIVNEMAYMAADLESATNYEIYIRSICAPGDSSEWLNAATFTTRCDILDLDYHEDFTTMSSSSAPQCWSEGDNSPVSEGPLYANGAWTLDGFMNVETSGAAKINLYAANKHDWLISPSFNIPATGSFQVEYDFGIAQFASTTIGSLGSDDQVLFLISTDGGINWTTLDTYDRSYQTPAGGDLAITHLLTDYAGQSVTFAFWASEGTVDDEVDVDVSIDNFKVRATPTCEDVTDVNISEIGSYDAAINWANSSTASSWDLIIQLAGTGNPDSATMVMTVDTNYYMAAELLDNTPYEVYLRSNCGDGDLGLWSGPYNFTTLCPVYAPDYVQSFVELVCWTEGQNSEIADGPNNDNGAWRQSTSFMNLGDTTAMAINLYSDSKKDWLVSPIFSVTEATIVGYEFGITNYASQDPGLLGSDDEVHFLISVAGGDWMSLTAYDSSYVSPASSTTENFNLAEYAGQTVQFAFWASEGEVNDPEDVDVFVTNFRVSQCTSTTGVEEYTGCASDGYTVMVNGVTYDESNPSGTEVLTNVAGCDSTVTINLSFSPALELSVETIDASDDVNDGHIDLSVAGGTAPFSYAWSNGETTEDLEDLAAGNYTVTVSDANGCSMTIETTIGTIVGTNEIEGLVDFRISPNPSSTLTKLNIAFEEVNDFNISIINELGQSVRNYTNLTGRTHALELDVTSFTTGVYFIKVSTVKGQQSVKRFVVLK